MTQEDTTESLCDSGAETDDDEAGEEDDDDAGKKDEDDDISPLKLLGKRPVKKKGKKM